jgi:hypothetical protein
MKRVITNPHDYLGLRGKRLKMIFLGTLAIGALVLGLWQKLETVRFGEQRLTTYVGNSTRKHPEIILTVTVYLTSSGSLNRDASLPGWNPSSNWVDVIGGGGGGNYTGGYPGSYGGGGGGYARYNNMPALPATVSYVVGAGGGPGGAGGATSFNSGACAANGGNVGVVGGGGQPGGGSAGSYGYSGGPGGPGNGNNSLGAGYGGGGGGAAGPFGNGAGGAGASTIGGGSGGNGGPSGGGAGGGAGQNFGSAGSPGNEYQAGVGSGGGGGGGTYQTPGMNAGAYGGGGGGGSFSNDFGSMAPGNGAQGLITIVYTPLASPVVSSCTPNTGFTLGGTNVTISGSGFVNVVSVTFGGVAASSVAVVNANTITCVTPNHAAGVVDIVVNVSGGVAAGTGSSLFTYTLRPSGGFNMPMMGI